MAVWLSWYSFSGFTIGTFFCLLSGTFTSSSFLDINFRLPFLPCSTFPKNDLISFFGFCSCFEALSGSNEVSNGSSWSLKDFSQIFSLVFSFSEHRPISIVFLASLISISNSSCGLETSMMLLFWSTSMILSTSLLIITWLVSFPLCLKLILSSCTSVLALFLTPENKERMSLFLVWFCFLILSTSSLALVLISLSRQLLFSLRFSSLIWSLSFIVALLIAAVLSLLSQSFGLNIDLISFPSFILNTALPSFPGGSVISSTTPWLLSAISSSLPSS